MGRRVITQELLSELFTYDAAAGALYRKISRRGREAYVGALAGSRSGRYVMVRIDGRAYPLHQIIWFLHHGCIPKEIDHINQDKHDNRIENLRACSRRQNTGNTTLRTTNTSGYKGAFFARHANKWRASIKVNTRAIHLGYFNDPLDAARAYDAAAIRYFGEFACTNKVGVCDE